MKVNLDYCPTEKQERFHACEAKHKLYGGAAGGGKTQAILFELFMNCLMYPGLKQLFIRRTYPEIREILEERLPRLFKGGKPYRRNKSDNTILFNGSTIVLGYFSDEKKADRYFSMEYDVIAVDEVTRTIYDYKSFEKLVSRNRSSNQNIIDMGFKPYFMAGTNPGGLGHQRVKSLWIDKTIPNGYDASDFEFIPATLRDNPHLLQADPYYEKRLMALQDESLKKALLYGDRNIFEGQYFSEYLETEHVRDVFKYVGGPKKSILCLDYGFTNQSAVYRIEKDNDSNFYVGQEIYQTKLTYEELGKKIKERYDLDEIDYIVADPAIFAKNGSANSGAEILKHETGKGIVPADNARIPGRMLMKQLFKEGRLFIHKSCSNLIRTIPFQIYDDKKDGDLDTRVEDHALDAIRYGLMDIATPQKNFKDIEKLNDLFTKDEDEENFLKKSF